MNKTDMSPKAITLRFKKLTQLRKLCMSLKIAGEEKKTEIPSNQKSIQNAAPNE